jgi:tRNA (guanosine-2'-O-)-methyltransferase
MKRGWGRFRAYMDELEELMRLSGGQLAELEAMLAETWERDAWRATQQSAADVELVRRALDVPFMRELVEAAWRVGDQQPLDAPDFSGREWQPGEDHTALLSSERASGRRVEGSDVEPGSGEPPARLRAAERALADRSRSLVVLLDNLVSARNGSAIVRTSEALGLQEVHFVQQQGKLELERTITMRAQSWLDLHWYPAAERAIGDLRERGYRILVSDFTPDARPLEEVELTDKVAVAFGSEQLGVSDALREAADDCFYLPVSGFTAYINVSVMAGVALYVLDRRLRAEGLRAPLDEADRTRLRRAWYTTLARGDEARAREYLGWLDHPPEPSNVGRGSRPYIRKDLQRRLSVRDEPDVE